VDSEAASKTLLMVFMINRACGERAAFSVRGSELYRARGADFQVGALMRTR